MEQLPDHYELRKLQGHSVYIHYSTAAANRPDGVHGVVINLIDVATIGGIIPYLRTLQQQGWVMIIVVVINQNEFDDRRERLSQLRTADRWITDNFQDMEDPTIIILSEEGLEALSDKLGTITLKTILPTSFEITQASETQLFGLPMYAFDDREAGKLISFE